MVRYLIFVLIIFASLTAINGEQKYTNKYSEEANTKHEIDNNKKQKPKNERIGDSQESFEKYGPDYRNMQYPFRMAKLNLVWAKAQQRLTEPKLKSLFLELKIQDKEEQSWKQLNAQHKDKNGLIEAELRLKLTGIMSSYDLLEHFEEAQDPEKNKYFKGRDGPVKSGVKSIFRDKKLNQLWEKAESVGFTSEELKALKEEFQHHQNKVDLFYSMLDKLAESSNKQDYHENAVDEEELDRFNEIMTAEETTSVSNDILNSKHDHYTHNANQLRDKHREIRDSIDRLERKTGKGPNAQEFIEPKVQGLWRSAIASDFTPDELTSLKTELLHYESRLLKLRQMHVDHALSIEKYKSAKHGDKKNDKTSFLEENIKKQQRKVEKYHADLESRIFKHNEL